MFVRIHCQDNPRRHRSVFGRVCRVFPAIHYQAANFRCAATQDFRPCNFVGMGLKRVYGYHDEMAAFMALAYADIGGWPPVWLPIFRPLPQLAF